MSHNTTCWGSGNTLVLLTSSLLAALAVEALMRGQPRLAGGLTRGQRRLAGGLTLATGGLGVAFLAVKALEYSLHFQHGICPGGKGSWFAEHQAAGAGAPAFWTLYYVMTGAHALHVAVGVLVLAYLGAQGWRRKLRPEAPQALENGALYWHLVDVIWLFLWPCFYLVGRPSRQPDEQSRGRGRGLVLGPRRGPLRRACTPDQPALRGRPG